MPRAKKDPELTIEEIVAQHLSGINRGLQMCFDQFKDSPLPLIRVPGGELVIRQSMMKSKSRNRLIGSDSKAKETGEFTLTLQLREESDWAWKLRLGEITLVDEDGNEIPFDPIPPAPEDDEEDGE